MNWIKKILEKIKGLLGKQPKIPQIDPLRYEAALHDITTRFNEGVVSGTNQRGVLAIRDGNTVLPTQESRDDFLREVQLEAKLKGFNAQWLTADSGSWQGLQIQFTKQETPTP